MSPFSRGLAVASVSLFAIALTASSSGHAQNFPSGAIRIVVPTNAGSPFDIPSRVIANELSASEGWRVVVENRPGAIQTLGVADVLKQPASGHSVLAMGVPTLAGQILVPNARLRLDTDLAPVVQVSTGYNVLVVHPSIPARSVSELVALLKKQPGKLNFASGGVGNPAHLIGEMFKLRTGTSATHVPYPQGQQFTADLLSGTTQFSFITSVRVVDLVAASKLRALAIMGPKRLPAMPDVPTIVEEGYPELVAEDWMGFAARSTTPSDIIARLNEAVNNALKKPAVREAFVGIGHEPVGGTSAVFGQLVSAQLGHWSKVIHDANITAH